MIRAGGWDIHTHLLPYGLADMARDGLYGMSLGDGHVAVHGFKLSLASMGRPEALLERIDGDGLDGAVAAIPPPLFRADLSAGERPAYVQRMNDGLLEAVSAHARLRAMAYLPTDMPGLALKVAETLDERWAGVIVGTDIGTHSYADPDYHRLWKTLSERGLPVLVHPSESKDPRLSAFYLSNLLGNPMETALAAAQMIFGDLPSRFPRLRVILSHGGGATASLLGRWQRGLETQRPGIKPLGIPPKDAGSWFYVDTIVHSPAMLNLLAETMGSDHLLLGSDWPFPMGAPDAGHDIRHLAAELQKQIRGPNALSVFGAGRLPPGAA
ncbi:amidohydrolase family protein [Nitratireductor soli]|uniref:amidohydrolase family protein n=1 Tax=Nitratireductor soli TaxID=1670619 RepID=UPI00065E1BC2|nr:amidohydrolase family protein [Nitratireductor soli]